MTTTREPKWDELVPLPSIFDPNARITFLQSLLVETNPYYQPPRQHENIKAAIKMYESGVLNGDTKVLIAGGKIVSQKEALECDLPVWGEVSCHVISKSQSPLTGPGRFLPSVSTTKSIVSFLSATRGAYRKIRISCPHLLSLFFSFRS